MQIKEIMFEELNLEEFNLEEPSLEELSNELEAQRIKDALNSVQKLNLQELADILGASNIMSTVNHAGILIHIIDHPTNGTAATIQSACDGALLIRRLLI
ncbi:hypothetical protein B0F87_10567 [Methylobacter tundripaludum]|uniref:Uncharacterized protein n=1 Tax=Methylobacter tundripaludum TaxID=173365 RepID=A0A2S6HDX9_9GAMM|nr:hypothetical protein [Methylobacter tundripaludum]PPK75601.1 hypothetical protein B0F87_10567 [Methylobacter tundripaludum]